MRNLLLPALIIASCAAAPSQAPLPDREIFRRGAGSLVKIVAWRKDGAAMGSGSLIGTDAKGHQLILTCAHLLKGAHILLVSISNDEPFGKEPPLAFGEIVKVDEVEDLGLVKLLSKLDLVTLDIERSPIGRGDPVYYFGDADEAPGTFGRGVLTKTYFPGKTRHYSQYTGFAWPGMSGGPVLGEFGTVIGIVTAVNVVDDPHDDEKKVMVPQVGYMTPLPAIQAFLKGLTLSR